jgi:Flp pilus assembly protein TadD
MPQAAALRRSGSSHARHGRFAEAAADFTKLLKIRPGDTDAWCWREAPLMQAGQLVAYRELRQRS